VKTNNLQHARVLFLWAVIALCTWPLPANAQCNACEADLSCTSDNGFPTICPSALPNAFTGESYEETITFFMPAEVVDPGSGISASLNSVTVTSITGVPLGLEVELDDDDAVYYPASGQTSGCANVCGVPVLAGTFDMVISISALASAFGIEQVVTESFSYVLIVEAGEAGTDTFTFTPPAGCDSLVAQFQASLAGNANQITTYAWDFGNGQTASAVEVTNVAFDTTGVYNVTLQTTISDQILTSVTLNSTAGGGWDDGWSPSPDPYFVISDGAGGNVYVSSVADETYSNTWSNVNVVLANPPYTITFYDEDLFPDDDYLGSMSFTPYGAGAIDINADPSYGSLSIGLQTAVDAADTAAVYVNASPVVEIAWSGMGDTLICPTAGMIAYDWYWGDSLLVSGGDSTFVPVENGWYAVQATAETGCSGWSDSLLYCSADAAFALNLSLGETPEVAIADTDLAAYVWTMNGVVSDTLVGGNVWETSESGWYSAIGWDDYGCPWTSDTVLVCWPLGEPQVVENADGLLAVTPNYPYYQWWLNGEAIPGATDSVYANTGPGLYAVSVTDFPDCPGVISADWVVVGLEPVPGVEALKPTWKLYPNPAHAFVIFQLPESPAPWRVQAFDFQGRLVEEIQARTGERWSLEDWPAGTYIIRAMNAGSALPATRLIKQ